MVSSVFSFFRCYITVMLGLGFGPKAHLRLNTTDRRYPLNNTMLIASTVMLVLGLGLGLKANFFGLGLGLKTKSLALALCSQVLVVLNIVQV